MKIEIWNGTDWNNGSLHNGRFYVKRPDYPGGKMAGLYAARYHVVYWLKTGVVATRENQIHHIDGDCQNDYFENLQLINIREHTRKHKTKNNVTVNCDLCGKSFGMKPWRLKQRKGQSKSGKLFCSYKCKSEAQVVI